MELQNYTQKKINKTHEKGIFENSTTVPSDSYHDANEWNKNDV